MPEKLTRFDRAQLAPFRAKVIGDGQKYIEYEGELYPFTGRSAHDRLRHGDSVLVKFENHYSVTLINTKYGK